jgi:hypothetical protein
MSNDITAPHLWVLDSAGVVKAAGNKVVVRMVVYEAAVAADDLILQEYDAGGSAKSAIILKASASDVDWVYIDFGSDGLPLNGLVVGTIDGGKAYVYIKNVTSP